MMDLLFEGNTDAWVNGMKDGEKEVYSINDRWNDDLNDKNIAYWMIERKRTDG